MDSKDLIAELRNLDPSIDVTNTHEPDTTKSLMYPQNVEQEEQSSPKTAESRVSEEPMSSHSAEQDEPLVPKTPERRALEWIMLGNARQDSSIDGMVFESSAAKSIIIFLDAVMLTLRLICYSLIGVSTIAIFWVPARSDTFLDFMYVNYTAKEHIYIPDNSENAFIRSFRPHWDIIWPLYLPVSTLIYLRLSLKRSFIVIFLSLTVMVSCMCMHRVYHLTILSKIVPIISWPGVVLSVTTTENRRHIMMLILQQVSAFAIGLGVTQTNALTSEWESQEMANVLQLIIILPVFRELAYAFVKSSARHMALSPVAGGVDRRVTWLFVLWFQYLASIYVRLKFFRLQSNSTLTGVLIFQSIQEVALRLSQPYRELWLQRITSGVMTRFRRWKRFSSRVAHENSSTRESNVEPKSSRINLAWIQTNDNYQNSLDRFVGPGQKQNSPRVGASKKSVALSESQRWYAIPLVGEMLTEYTAIFTASIVIILFENEVLRFPIEYYVGLKDPFHVDHATMVNDALSSAAKQVAAEILVDSLCISIEKQRGFDLGWVFDRRHRLFSVMLFAAVWFGNVGVAYIISGGDHFTNCVGQDMCVCAVDAAGGLVSGGLRQQYCDYIQD